MLAFFLEGESSSSILGDNEENLMTANATLLTLETLQNVFLQFVLYSKQSFGSIGFYTL